MVMLQGAKSAIKDYMYRDNERQRFNGRERGWPGREIETGRNRRREQRKRG